MPAPTWIVGRCSQNAPTTHERACNRCVRGEVLTAGSEPVCDYCRFNETIPDLSVPGNREKWARIEAAKRRVLYVLYVLGLPYRTAAENVDAPHSFAFMADQVPEGGAWHSVGGTEQVFTGHAGGRITINIREADDAEREKLRTQFGEAHRTLIGHLRHEIAHDFWDLLVHGRHEDAFRSLFGDHENPPYQDALDGYYEEGPPSDWQTEFVSAYATMHPWEDWAETFALYLDVASVVETAANMGLIHPVAVQDLDGMLTAFRRVGVVAHELNRTQGLIDLVPEVITPPVERKLRFVHRVVHAPTVARSDAHPEDPATPSS